MTVGDGLDWWASLESSRNDMGHCVVLVLAWIAACDGHIDADEVEMLHHVAGDELGRTNIAVAIQYAQQADHGVLLHVCHRFQELDWDKRILLMQLAISMALRDGYLAVPENHVLRFLADLLGISDGLLDRLFRERTGRELPEPGDVSSVNWWEQREHETRRTSKGAAGHENSSREEPCQRFRGEMSVVQARAVLGIEEGASQDEIRTTYRRLAKIHHPDRFATLGPEAVEAATEVFKRISRAYEVLRTS